MNMTEWVPLGDTGIQVNADRLNDPDTAERIAQILDYRLQCQREGRLMDIYGIAAAVAGALRGPGQP